MSDEEFEDDVDMHEHPVDEEDEEEEEVDESNKEAYIPSLNGPLQPGEQLEFDADAYKVFHSFETTWPCMTFDVVPDGLGDNRSTLPMECYIVAGTQAETAKQNEILVMSLKNLTGLHEDDGNSSDEEGDDEKENENEARIHAISIPTYGGTNRIKVNRLGDSTVCAVWNDTGKVQLWNVTDPLNTCNKMTGNSATISTPASALFSFVGSKQEGYGLGWSPTKTGTLATGDVAKNIYIWNMHEGGTWAVDQRPFHAHNGSVEDIAWSPKEAGLLASCSSDGTVRLWDTRSPPAEACVCTVEKAHDSDVNVLSWNPNDDLIVTGGDDAELKVWSLKTIQFGQPVARFKYHTGPITSVEWSPTDSTTFMASGEDDQTSIWDIATEADGDETVEGVPPQLMFLHMGQQEVKEVHWHAQIPGLALTTSLEGFNIFKTMNM